VMGEPIPPKPLIPTEGRAFTLPSNVEYFMFWLERRTNVSESYSLRVKQFCCNT